MFTASWENISQSWYKRKIPPPEKKEPFTPKKKHMNFVELKLRNKKKNIKLKYHTYSISKLRIEVKSKIKVK